MINPKISCVGLIMLGCLIHSELKTQNNVLQTSGTHPNNTPLTDAEKAIVKDAENKIEQYANGKGLTVDHDQLGRIQLKDSS
ncbi:MAG: hypothetical protein HQM08_25615 [Candidatus Riflebacteria bacterium]|nr:hypothetical protein [Candidatus Riflebacteria bacterium]